MVSTDKSYYSAALERIEDAHLLHTEGHYAFAMYASGLAVECLLRAFRLLRDTSFDERHDLWELWRKTALKDAPGQSAYERIYALLSEISLRWRNSYRFAAENEARAALKKSGLDRGVKGNFLKYNSKKLCDDAKEFLRLGGQQWTPSSKK
jgi:HEPN domain-containing protein